MVNENNYVIWLKGVNRQSHSLVGGKGANLGEMFSKFPIPNGFCITVDAYNKFLDSNGLRNKISAILDNLEIQNNDCLEKSALQIRTMILDAEMPKDIINQTIKNYNQLNNRKVAVRSSATAEDLLTASFAGQQETYLNIEDKNSLINAVNRCWASLYTSRAIYYRNKHGFKQSEVKIGVVVQEMVDAKYAGVMFTLDPAHKKYSLIEVIEGLGEKLVSGQVTPNTYFLNRETAAIEDSNLVFALDENIVKRISEYGKEIEQHYNHPMDVEWAINRDGDIYILQARHITTL